VSFIYVLCLFKQQTDKAENSAKSIYNLPHTDSIVPFENSTPINRSNILEGYSVISVRQI